MNILVTGANGQLGNEMRRVSSTSSNHYIFTDVAELDITSRDSIRKMVNDNQIHVIVNCAAYTNVDKAEDDFATADLLNNKAVENLAVVAKETDATLIHVSTDYVFRETEMSLVGKIGKLILWVCMVKRSWLVSIAYRKPAVIILSFVPLGFIPLMGRIS